MIGRVIGNALEFLRAIVQRITTGQVQEDPQEMQPSSEYDEVITVPAVTEPIPLNWAAEGDEWVGHLFDSLGDVSGHSARGMEQTDDFPYPFVEFTPRSETVRTTLRLVLLKHGIFPFVAFREPWSPAVMNRWSIAVWEAGQRLGKAHETFAWAAVIGPDPRDITAGIQELEQASAAGPLMLRSAGLIRRDVDMSRQPPSLGSYDIDAWCPIIVEGVAQAYDWNAANRIAGQQIHRLVTLLSLEWDRCWTLRSVPQRADPGQWVVSERSPWIRDADEENRVFGDPTKVAIPEWFDSAWERVGQDAVLSAALGVFHEGLRMLNEHPSFALIAFVAALEALGARYVSKPERCSECGAVTGSTKRFREALSLVVPPPEAERLARAYTSRSKTAHAGILHGGETAAGVATFGGGFLSLIGGEGPDSFVWQTTFRMGRAARDLLLRALKDDPPT